jgi:hypothetical protein
MVHDDDAGDPVTVQTAGFPPTSYTLYAVILDPVDEPIPSLDGGVQETEASVVPAV